MKRALLAIFTLLILLSPALAKGKSGGKATTIHLTEAQFLERVYNYQDSPDELVYLGDKPALIDIYASWCGPCKQIAPILEELAAEYDGEIYIYKIDTDRESALASYFNIRSIPSLLFIPMEGKPTMSQGAMLKSQLQAHINKLLLEKE